MRIKRPSTEMQDQGGNPYAPLPDAVNPFVPDRTGQDTNTPDRDLTVDTVPDAMPIEPMQLAPDPIPVRIVEQNSYKHVKQLRTLIVPVPVSASGYLPFELIGAMAERTSLYIRNRGPATIFISEDTSCNPNINAKLLAAGEFVTYEYSGTIYALATGATVIEVQLEYITDVIIERR